MINETNYKLWLNIRMMCWDGYDDEDWSDRFGRKVILCELLVVLSLLIVIFCLLYVIIK
jgi:hypothetical protein